MGHDLYRMLRASEVFPAATPGEQAAALIIADICMDTTRKPPKNMNAGARVCEDLGITPGSLGNILAKLAARDLSFACRSAGTSAGVWSTPRGVMRSTTCSRSYRHASPKVHSAMELWRRNLWIT